MKMDEAIDLALKTVPRNEDGMVDWKLVLDEVARLIDFDATQERRNKASRGLKRRCKPGSTLPVGQLCLPGLAPYAYEPDRLVADNEGHIVEQKASRPTAKAAEAERTRVAARRATAWADRKTQESALFAAWAIVQLQNGRRIADITFDAFVREANMWSPDEAPPEPGPDEEDGDE